MRIKSVQARQIINSKGFPTLEVEVSTHAKTAISSVPLAASKSKYEFYDVFDHDLKKFDGQTLEVLVENINRVVAPELFGRRAMDQEDLDELLLKIDGSFDRSKLGVNAITALSQAFAKVGAMESDLPLYKYIRVLNDFSDHHNIKLQSTYELPKPVITIMRSASHNLSTTLPFQEFMVVPRGKFSYLNDLVTLFETLQKHHTEVNPNTFLELIDFYAKDFAGSKVKLDFGLDISASRYKREDSCDYALPNFNKVGTSYRANAKKLTESYVRLINKYPLVFLEDGLDEDEFAGWHELLQASKKVNNQIQIVSDDFTASNIERLEKIATLECANNIVIKPSQIGTVSELIHLSARARKLGVNVTVSYRFGETEDNFISDLAVGIAANYIRTGFYLGSEYNSKLNRLVAIEQSL
jgi:enolase